MVLTVLFSAGFVLLLHGVTPAIAENRYSSSGTLRGVVYSDCTSGKRLAKSRFWLDGELRSFDERSNAVRFRENRNRDGSLRSLRVWEPNGLDINFSRRRIRFDGTGTLEPSARLRASGFFRQARRTLFMGRPEYPNYESIGPPRNFRFPRPLSLHPGGTLLDWLSKRTTSVMSSRGTQRMVYFSAIQSSAS